MVVIGAELAHYQFVVAVPQLQQWLVVVVEYRTRIGNRGRSRMVCLGCEAGLVSCHRHGHFLITMHDDVELDIIMHIVCMGSYA